MRARRLRLWAWLLLPLLALIVGVGWAAPTAQVVNLQDFIFDTRADLEQLADAVYPAPGFRPEGWTFNTDAASMTAASDLWFDLQILAAEVYGADFPPPGWFGLTSPEPAVLARNVRHDLELTADAVFAGEDPPRPLEWRGAPPLLRCDRTVQNAVALLQEFFGFQLAVPESVFDYCAAVRNEVDAALIEAVYGGQELPGFTDLLLDTRGDLERLADELLGLDNRPDGWLRNVDSTSPTFVSDLFLDLELLADNQLGAGERPDGWVGATTFNNGANYLNLRHDLELLADATLGFNARPTGWQPIDPLIRCQPRVQYLTTLSRDLYGFDIPPTLDTGAPGFCAGLSAAVNLTIEDPPVADVVEGDAGDSRFLAESNFAFAYLDPAATQYMGIMPGGTEFRAWYRNYADSNMMFVSSDDFAVYVSYEFTTLPQELFDALPTIENREPLTFCDASWCNGPGPTPTPTGFGPLAAVLQEATPPAPATPTGIPGGEVGALREVSWNNIRVTYFEDDLEARRAQVGLEICASAAQAATSCESVIRVTDVNGNILTPLTQINGLNVYEFEYGYTTGVLIEGETLFSRDIWISDPTIR